MRYLDPFLLLGELAARQLYWRVPAVVDAYQRRRDSSIPGITVERARLRDRLEEIGVVSGALVMLHSSIANLALTESGAGVGAAPNPLVVASQLLHDFRSLVGKSGTLTMPSHPLHEGDPGFMRDKSQLVLPYDVRKTPSMVGLLTNIFYRRPDVRRSRHPLSAVASLGPLTEELLRDNLNDDRPLPHGAHSAYCRFCDHGGLVVSLGRPLIKCMTVLHVAEEVKEGEWPVPRFFYDRRFVISDGESEKEWTVRERRPQFVRCLGLGQVRRDLLREGLLHESTLSGLRVDWANSGDIRGFMMRKNIDSTYPYYLPSTALL